MKPSPFSYHAPSSVEEAISLLVAYAGEAKLIAGGQSLMPMLAFRLFAPAALVDVRRLPGLDAIELDDDGLHLGARVRWRDIEHHAALARRYPLLAEAVRHVAHDQIRNRGTIGGSLAHADPAAEFPAAALLHGAVIEVAGPSGRRRVAVDDFLLGLLTTDLADDEIILGVRLPPWPEGARWGLREFARRRGDFAMAGIALRFTWSTGGIAAPAVVAFGVGPRPVRLAGAEALLSGADPAEDLAAAFGAAVAGSREIDPPCDLQGSPEYRRALLAALAERALADAIGRPETP